MRVRAVIFRWNDEKGFGFASLRDNPSHPDVFVHANKLMPATGRAGLTIECLVWEKEGRFRARDVRIIDDDEAPTPKPSVAIAQVASTPKRPPVIAPTPERIDTRPVPPKLAAILDEDKGSRCKTKR